MRIVVRCNVAVAAAAGDVHSHRDRAGHVACGDRMNRCFVVRLRRPRQVVAAVAGGSGCYSCCCC